jgi:ascorbate-specific PTS system EIIC-type component UlaA
MSLVYTLILGSLLILVSFFAFVSKISYDSKNIRKNLENGSLPEVLSFQKNKYKIIIIVNFLIIVGYLAIFVLLKSYTNIKIIILLSHYLLWIAFTISIIYNDLFAHLLLKQQLRKTIVK